MPDDLCPVCGAYWQCECRRGVSVTHHDVTLYDSASKPAWLNLYEKEIRRIDETLSTFPPVTVEHLEAVRDEYGERYP